MFQIFILLTNLDIQIGFFRYYFEFFGLSIGVRLIILRVWICFVTLYKTHSNIFFTFHTGYISDFSVWAPFGFMSMPSLY